MEGDKIILLVDTEVILVDLRIARLSKPITRYYYRYGYRRGYVLDQIKAQVNCRVIDYLGKKVIDLSIARR
ncbi:MAG: hypothetical protein DRO40_11655 [Thermoprotei archaeon]|nr:MAG: hypothetical protein DRO40_11655 [Thermoprotei archaeon]